MFIKKSTVITISTLSFTLISNQALAVESTGSTTLMSAWPLILLAALFIVFRKKIFAETTFTETTIDSQEENNQEITEQKETAPAAKTTPSPKKSPKPAKKTTKPKATTSTKKEAKSSTSNNDLSDDGQCQGSTAKGSRCKRTTTLEKMSVTIDNKTYQLTACSQHKNDKFKPYPGLIK